MDGNSDMHDAQILIAGGGPASVATAIGLRRLGYTVMLISQPRPFSAVEGVSDRVLQSMKSAGFHQAIKTLAPPSPRNVTWNGLTSAADTEHLIERRLFDEALLQDAETAGVRVIRGRFRHCQAVTDGWQAEAESAAGESISVSGHFLVEARGRAAPAAKTTRVRSSETIALLQRWRGPADTPLAHSAVQSCADGWAWMAQLADGSRYLQLAVDTRITPLPAKNQLTDWCRQRFEQLHQAHAFIKNAEPEGEVYARASTQILCEDLIGENYIRIGDAAMAVDPLSGNGIFQSMSSALQAPAVIHTLLQKPENTALARQFYQARVEGLFYRFARTGRDFCRLEQQWPESEFWASRCHWPDDQPLHLPADPQQVEVARRPVIKNHLIEEADVVVTPDQPLGIWHVNGIELAPVMAQIKEKTQPALKTLTELFGEARGKMLGDWLKGQGLV